MLHATLVFVHLAAVVFWVGGISFVQVALRPALAHLQGPDRLRLLDRALARYFAGVGICIALIFGTGLAMMHAMAVPPAVLAAPAYVQAMATIGVLMLLMYLHTMAGPYKRLRVAVAAEDWPAGAAAMAQIRLQGASNLFLGLLAMAAALHGRVLL